MELEIELEFFIDIILPTGWPLAQSEIGIRIGIFHWHNTPDRTAKDTE
jgi:hypothetical protein